MISKRISHLFAFAMITSCLVIVITCWGFILINVVYNGWSVIGWEFLFKNPKNGMTEGGIFSAIFGTTMVTFISCMFSAPIGIACAVYLNEYTKDNWVTKLIRASIRNLASIPSIVFGLFGLAVFVKSMGFGPSILSAGLTLGLLTLPILITTTEEALRKVPSGLREGAVALGATKFEMIITVLLPSSLSGIFTGIVLSLSRAAGETAPILLTGAAFYSRYLPGSIKDEFMALPYHLYVLSTQHSSIEQVRPLAYGTAVVLIALVFFMNIMVFILRSKHQKKFYG